MGALEQQVKVIFKAIEAILQEAVMTLNDVVRVRVYLQDAADYGAFNQLYEGYFEKCKVPTTRTTVQAGLPLGALVEIEVDAYKE